MGTDHSLSLWRDHIKQHPWTYLLGGVAVGVGCLMQVFSTRMVGWIIDFFQHEDIPITSPWGEGREDTFWWLFTLFLTSTALLMAVRFLWRRTLARQVHRASSKLKRELWEHVRFFDRYSLQAPFSKGILMNALTSDVSSARNIFGFTMVIFVDVLILGVATLWAMVAISPLLALCVLGALVLIPFLAKWMISVEVARYERSQRSLGLFDELVSQCVGCIRLQRATAMGGLWTEKMAKQAENYRYDHLQEAFATLRYLPVMGGVWFVAYLILFFVGIHLVFQGSISVGDFVAMQGLVLLMEDPLFELGALISDWKKGRTSLARLWEIFSHPKDPTVSTKKNGDVALRRGSAPLLEARGLNFRYPDAPPSQGAVLSDFSLTIAPGEKLGITGPIGAGKTTLVKILAGLERLGAGQGEVLFHGALLSSFSHNWLRQKMALVPQRPFLFATSVAQNISLDRPLSEDELWWALEVAGMEEDVATLPLGPQTPLGEWGVNLSGGQKLRLSLARAVARRPEVLLFDDCFSAVDQATEDVIILRLEQHLKGVAIVWVAHRQSTLAQCDRVITMGGK